MINEHDYRACVVENCEDCQELVDECFVLACDDCDFVGSAEVSYPSWQIQSDGRVLCQSCAEEEKK